MLVEESSRSVRSKTLYKLLILLLKYIPMLIAICYLLSTLMAIFGLESNILSHLSGMSLFTWIFLYLASVVFRFCMYHKMFLWYILTDDLVNIVDYYVGIPVSNLNIIAIHCVIAGIFLFIILYLHQRKI